MVDEIEQIMDKEKYISKKIKVVQYGCGSIGFSIIRLLTKKSNIEIVGAIDLVNVGHDLGKVAGLGYELGIPISKDPTTVLSKTKPDIVLHTTGSILKEVYPQLEKVIRAGVNIISTNEELSYPFEKQPALAACVDQLAKEYRITVLSTGVNPGFVMDTLPLVMTGVC